eukprot:GHVU01010321.1.p1 GENE.GHVU01010321.1~~GHVU01010321.1.p1  ORF type:complete len:141 (-),score=5.47 GHVU01010321.1:246-668(-)
MSISASSARGTVVETITTETESRGAMIVMMIISMIVVAQLASHRILVRSVVVPMVMIARLAAIQPPSVFPAQRVVIPTTAAPITVATTPVVDVRSIAFVVLICRFGGRCMGRVSCHAFVLTKTDRETGKVTDTDQSTNSR